MAQAVAKWEYLALVHESATDLAAEMNEAGQAGWEMVAIFAPQGTKGLVGWTAFLKRPTAGQPAAQRAKDAAPESEKVKPAPEAAKAKPAPAARTSAAAAKTPGAKAKSPSKEPESGEDSGFEVADDTFDLQL
jgi:hypothetical protein